MTIRSSILTMITCALLGIAWAPITMAQGGPPSVEPSPSSVSDAELKSFAVAVLEVQRINDAYMPRFHASKTPEEQHQVENAASREMTRAVEKQGMTVDKYKQIMTLAQKNPQVAERIKDHMRNVP